jgi:hypothetical protein
MGGEHLAYGATQPPANDPPNVLRKRGFGWRLRTEDDGRPPVWRRGGRAPQSETRHDR